MTIREWLKKAEEQLTQTDCPDPAIDARWIAEDILHMNTPALRFEGTNTLSDVQLASLDECLERRKAGEPVQYVLNHSDFMGLHFYVDSRVLIPRQDTETLVEAAVISLQPMHSPSVLDLCCGSGCIGISIKNLIPHAEVTLSDISGDAIEVARRNAKALETHVTFKHGDLFDAVGRSSYDMIVSNPPYIPTNEVKTLQREVRYEPELALDGGEDGLCIYRRIVEAAGKHLNPHGYIYMEVGEGEAADVLQMLRSHINCETSGIIKDLCGIDRIIWARSK